MKPSYEDIKAERDNALALLADAHTANANLAREHQQAFAALDELRDAFWEADDNRDKWALAGAAALIKAFPHMHADYTTSFFIKIADIVLNATASERNLDAQKVEL